VPVRPGLANRPGLLHPDFVFVLHPTRNTRIERVRRRKEVAAATVVRDSLMEWGRKPAEHKKRDFLKENYKHCPKQTAIEAGTACL